MFQTYNLKAVAAGRAAARAGTTASGNPHSPHNLREQAKFEQWERSFSHGWDKERLAIEAEGV